MAFDDGWDVITSGDADEVLHKMFGGDPPTKRQPPSLIRRAVRRVLRSGSTHSTGVVILLCLSTAVMSVLVFWAAYHTLYAGNLRESIRRQEAEVYAFGMQKIAEEEIRMAEEARQAEAKAVELAAYEKDQREQIAAAWDDVKSVQSKLRLTGRKYRDIITQEIDDGDFVMALKRLAVWSNILAEDDAVGDEQLLSDYADLIRRAIEELVNGDHTDGSDP